MNAVVIGAGRIGLGFAAQITAAAGMEVVVLGRGATIEQVRQHGQVLVRLTDGQTTESHCVPIAEGIDIQRQHAAAVAAIANADLVCTAVGPSNLATLSGLLVEGLSAATHPIDVIAFENLADAREQLLTNVSTAVPATAPQHGYSGAVVDRVMAQRRPATEAMPVTLVGERHTRFAIGGAGLVHDWSALPGVEIVDDFHAAFRRKLHRYSAGHAAAAYLGRVKGYQYVHSAVADSEIAEAVVGAMEEGRQGLLAAYGAEVAGTKEELYEILHRFGNAALNDTTERVGRDVPRKVSRSERLVGAARSAQRAGIEPRHLALVTAAALATEVAPQGAARARRIQQLTGLPPAGPILSLIDTALERMQPHVALLSLALGTPAWSPSDSIGWAS